MIELPGRWFVAGCALPLPGLYFMKGDMKVLFLALPVTAGLVFAPTASAEPLVVINYSPTINVYKVNIVVVNVIQTNRGYYGVNGPVNVTVNQTVNENKPRQSLAPRVVRERVSTARLNGREG